MEYSRRYSVISRQTGCGLFGAILRAFSYYAIQLAILACISLLTPAVFGFDVIRVPDDVEQGDIGKGDVILVVGSDGVTRLTAIQDFDDIHIVPIRLFDQLALGGSFGSGPVDAVSVIWLGDDHHVSDRGESTVPLPRAAHALAMRDWQLSGIEGGALGPQVRPHDSQGFDEFPFPETSLNVTRNGIGVLYGLRALEKNDQEYRSLRGTVVHDMHWRNGAANQLLGPQAGILWLQNRGWWSFYLQGSVLAGYNQIQIEQIGGFEIASIPGALNQVLFSRQSIDYVETNHVFSPCGELCAETKWHITQALRFKLAWSALYLYNVALVEDRTVYRLPDMGLRDPGTQHFFVQDVFCGIEFMR